MTYPIFGNEVPKMSAQQASLFIKKMVLLESIVTGSKETAITSLAREFEFTESQIIHLYKRRAKSCDVTLYARIRLAYLKKCGAIVQRLLHNIETQEAMGTDDFDQDLHDRASALDAEVKAKKAALLQQRGTR
jgi:hypothetical protein